MNKNEQLPASATAVVDQLEIHVPLAGLIDKSEELKRLNKEIEKLNQQKTALSSRLNNKTFIEKAPEAVVIEAKAQLNEYQLTLEKLRENLARIEQLSDATNNT